ncbi:aspartate/ornithine carbamoyltransferase family protein, partial [Dyella silvatica]|uniref:aspartate/ornithine carbamoyltransferase family protein n=1 Tax=Dyella silvatica TaxID=2992128 RepID=UPI002251C8FD
MSPRLRHLTSLEHLPRATIERLLDRAEAMRDACAHGTRKLDLLAGRTVLNLFFEPSTRTRTSFELAARRLGADVINFDLGLSSTSKGEAMFDTLHTLEAMHLDAIIVRHKVSGTPDELVRHAMSGVSVINAGDGNRAHPTQGLLDVLTIRQHRPDFHQLTVTICGDVKHSRVARSDVHALTALGAKEIRLCAPPALMPEQKDFPHCRL